MEAAKRPIGGGTFQDILPLQKLVITTTRYCMNLYEIILLLRGADLEHIDSLVKNKLLPTA
jgi:hypothetical protein